MRIAVKVRLKPALLDPQGKAVHQALGQLGFADIEDVRVGKYIELRFPEGTSAEKARQEAETAAQKLLANPVMENYEIEYLED